MHPNMYRYLYVERNWARKGTPYSVYVDLKIAEKLEFLSFLTRPMKNFAVHVEFKNVELLISQ